MNFLIDENVGNSVVNYLLEKGHNVIVVSKGKYISREDAILVDYAFKEKCIIITNDKDFGFLIYRQKLPSRGVILFRFLKESPSHKISALKSILSLKPKQILDHFIIASEGKIRIRPIKKRAKQ